MKQKFTAIISLIALAFIMTLASCAPISDNVGGNGTTSSGGNSSQITIRLPPIGSSAIRALDAAQVSRLQRETAKYRVTFSGVGQTITREGEGTTYSATFPVGTQVSVTVYCLNAKGEIIVKTVTKNITISSGANSLSFKLSEDGTEIQVDKEDPPPNPNPEPKPDDTDKEPEEEETPDPQPPAPQPVPEKDKVKYSKGVATLGNVEGLPPDQEYEPGDTVTPPSQVTWDYGNFEGWKANVNLEIITPNGNSTAQAGDLIGVGSTFTMPDSGVVLTAQWQPTPYNITYEPNGGQTQTPISSQSFTATDGIVQLNNGDSFSNPGNVLTKWQAGGTDFANPNESVPVQRLLDLLAGGQSVTLTAKWEATSTTLYISNNGNDNANDGSQASPFATLQKAFDVLSSQSATTATVIALSNITATSTTTFNLAGKTVTLSSDSASTKRTITTGDKTVIELTDGTLKLENIIISGPGKDTGQSTESLIKLSNTSATLEINSGAELTGFSATASSNISCVYVSDGTVKMTNGGKIHNNKSTASESCAIRLQPGTFIMEGGEISDNICYGNAVALANGSSMTLSNTGKISNNEISAGPAGDGGAVEVNNGTFTMNGGEISGNRGYGTGVRINMGVGLTTGGFKMSGGTIQNNTTQRWGAGVFVNSGTVSMTGGSIIGNTSTGSTPAGVYIGNGCTFNIGDPDNTSATMSRIQITGNTANSSASNLDISGRVINFYGALTADSSIGISNTTVVGGIETPQTGDFTKNWTTRGNTDISVFVSDNSSYYVSANGDEVALFQ